MAEDREVHVTYTEEPSQMSTLVRTEELPSLPRTAEASEDRKITKGVWLSHLLVCL